VSTQDDLALRLRHALAAPGREELALVARELAQLQPSLPMTGYAHAELLRRDGDLPRALGASAAAIAGLFGSAIPTPGGRVGIGDVLRASLRLPPGQLGIAIPYLQQFGELAEANGLAQQMAPQLSALSGARPPGPAHAMAALHVLGFSERTSAEWAGRLFEELLVPWILDSARRGDFESALHLENFAYGGYVKRSESQAWFKATTSRWIPELAAATRGRARRYGEPNSAWRREKTRRVAFFVHNASLLAHVAVLVETLQAVHQVGRGDYDFTVFVLGGRHEPLERKLEECGVHLQYLDQEGPAGLFERILRLKRLLREGNYAACVWVSLVTVMAIAFPLRVAPLQVWWAMKYHSCDIDEIDARLALENAMTRKSLEGREWLTIGTATDHWVDATRAAPAAELRAGFPADAVVAACIGREEKLNSPEFLDAICELLRRNPKVVFLWSGRSRHPAIQGAFDRAGVADRARFVGWVDTKLYAQAIDVFLDSFPFPCGFTLKEAMAAGKPAVLYRSPESLETGVPGAITLIAEGAPGVSADVRERLRTLFSRERDFDLYLCADSPASYLEHALRLAADPELRRAAGEANRRYIAEFAADPRAEARKFLGHLDELLASLPHAA
jgi:glycosyltransferase involved in cell wall biosynthesis